jgi:RNA polymerase primary sigma factor
MSSAGASARRHIRTATHQLEQALRRQPTVAEIAAALGMLEEKMAWMQQPVSLDVPLSEESQSTLGEFVVDEQAEAPIEVASGQLLCEDLLPALDELRSASGNC